MIVVKLLLYAVLSKCFTVATLMKWQIIHSYICNFSLQSDNNVDVMYTCGHQVEAEFNNSSTVAVK